MKEKALIISMEDKIEAIHFEKEECASCTTGCAKIKNSFEISNPDNLEIKKGSVVMVEASKKSQALQGILSLLIPFLSSIAGYIFAPSIMGLLGKTISNDARAVFVLLFLTVSASIVFVITRKYPMPGKPEIVEVL
ncbi:SoxR reducing system RseC family protein [Treponema sp.]|uniref:SoxR reducing system RseC family protein n=1 Tax=Treponema sp. TaxID=166 RepID=UPI00388DB6CC